MSFFLLKRSFTVQATHLLGPLAPVLVSKIFQSEFFAGEGAEPLTPHGAARLVVTMVAGSSRVIGYGAFL